MSEREERRGENRVARWRDPDLDQSYLTPKRELHSCCGSGMRQRYNSQTSGSRARMRVQMPIWNRADGPPADGPDNPHSPEEGEEGPNPRVAGSVSASEIEM